MPDTRKPSQVKKPAPGPSHKGYKATPDEDRVPQSKPSPAASAKEPAPVKPKPEEGEATETVEETPPEPPVHTATMDKPRTV